MKKFAFIVMIFTLLFTGLIIGLTLSNAAPEIGWFAVIGGLLASAGSIVVYQGER